MNKYIEVLIKNGFTHLEEKRAMRELTSFHLGGPADVIVYPETEAEINKIVKICKEENFPYLIMGNGTNLVVSDGGIEGIVIAIQDKFSKVTVINHTIYAESGALLKDVAEIAQKNSLSGLEFAHGIPGSVGGAITMNAGAYGGETKDVVESVRVLTSSGEIKDIPGEEMNFRYRRSLVEDEGLVVLGVSYHLKAGDTNMILKEMEELMERRKSKQPLEMASAGSTFKRPEGYFAGKLIDDSGLRGVRHGGAQVSEKHCGFVINRDHATTKDVKELIEIVQKTVKDKFGVDLETEVKVIGR